MPQPILQSFIPDLGQHGIECCADDSMRTILDAPDEVSVTFSFEGSGVRQRRNAFAYHGWIPIVVLKLQPGRLGGEFAQLVDKTGEILSWWFSK
jgi:hypothetical protein